MLPFSNEREAVDVIVKLSNGRWTVPQRRKRNLDENVGQYRGLDEEVEGVKINELASDNISRTIIFYSNQTL